MSATAQSVVESEGQPSKQQRLKHYLAEKAVDGELYFKSKSIADEADLPPKETGALMA
jgi:hypothetical protein